MWPTWGKVVLDPNAEQWKCHTGKSLRSHSAALSLGLSFMNAKLVTVRVQDYRCPAAGQTERFKGELHVVIF